MAMMWKVKPQTQAMFPVSMAGRKVQPFTEVVTGQGECITLAVGFEMPRGIQVKKNPDDKEDKRRKGKESHNLQLELHLGTERKERNRGDDFHLGARARERGAVGGEFQGCIMHRNASLWNLS